MNILLPEIPDCEFLESSWENACRLECVPPADTPCTDEFPATLLVITILPFRILIYIKIAHQAARNQLAITDKAHSVLPPDVKNCSIVSPPYFMKSTKIILKKI